MPLQLESDSDPNAPQCPLRAARLALGLTQQDIAEYISVSPLTITLAEQGCYVEPPVGLLSTLCDLGKRAEWPADSLSALTLANYTAWQRRRRHYNVRNHEVKSFDDWYVRYCGSPSGLSKLLLVPLRTAQKFIRERGSSAVVSGAMMDAFGVGRGNALYCMARGKLVT